jgi:hypothetical protein
LGLLLGGHGAEAPDACGLHLPAAVMASFMHVASGVGLFPCSKPRFVSCCCGSNGLVSKISNGWDGAPCKSVTENEASPRLMSRLSVYVFSRYEVAVLWQVSSCCVWRSPCAYCFSLQAHSFYASERGFSVAFVPDLRTVVVVVALPVARWIACLVCHVQVSLAYGTCIHPPLSIWYMHSSSAQPRVAWFQHRLLLAELLRFCLVHPDSAFRRVVTVLLDRPAGPGQPVEARVWYSLACVLPCAFEDVD